MKHKPYLITNSILFFVLYSISLAYSFFLYGLEFPNVNGIGLVWLFPGLYLLFLILSLRLIFVQVNAKTYITHGIFPLAVVTVSWILSMFVFIVDGQKDQIIPNSIYPSILLIVSVFILIMYLKAYACSKKSSVKIEL